MDVEYSLKEYVKQLTFGTGITVQIRVEKNMCQIMNEEPFDRNTKIAGYFFITILLISILSTIIEHIQINPSNIYNTFLIIYTYFLL